jgi:hypothetical protein
VGAASGQAVTLTGVALVDDGEDLCHALSIRQDCKNGGRFDSCFCFGPCISLLSGICTAEFMRVIAPPRQGECSVDPAVRADYFDLSQPLDQQLMHT